MSKLVIYTLFATGIILFTYAVVQLAARNKTKINYQISMMFFLSGYFILYMWFSRTGILRLFPWIMYSDISVSFLLGPLIYSYTRNISGLSSGSTRLYFLRYIPAAAAFIFLHFYNPDSSMILAAGHHPGREKHFVYLFIVNMLADIQLGTYFLLSAITVYKIIKVKGSSDKILHRLFSFYVLVLLSFPLFLLSYFLHNDMLINIGLLIDVLGGAYLLILSHRYPEYTQKIIKLRRDKASQSQSILKGVDVQEVISRLNELMQEEKAYRSTDIAIQSLSNDLGIKTYQLSEILNEHLNTNFRSFINTYRVKEAQSLLVNDPEKSILEIAYAVGFNSKSAFNNVFIKETGLSPTEFRKKNKK